MEYALSWVLYIGGIIVGIVLLMLIINTIVHIQAFFNSMSCSYYMDAIREYDTGLYDALNLYADNVIERLDDHTDAYTEEQARKYIQDGAIWYMQEIRERTGIRRRLADEEIECLVSSALREAKHRYYQV